MAKMESMGEVDKALDLLLSRFRLALSMEDTVEGKNKVQEKTKAEVFDFISKLTN